MARDRGQAAGRFGEAVDYIRSAAEQAGGVTESGYEAGRRALRAAGSEFADRPLVAVGVSALVGFILGYFVGAHRNELAGRR